MAEEYSVSLNVDSKEATKGLQAVEKEVNALDKEFQDLVQTMDGDASKAMSKLEDDMLALAQAGKRGSAEYQKMAEMLGRANQAANLVSKDIENLSVASNDVSAQISVFEDRLYELSLAGKQNTQEYKDLIQQVGNLKRTVAETDIAIERASTTSMDLGQQVGLLEDQLYQLAIEGKKDTEEFKKMAQEAGKLKQKIIEADMAVEEYAATNADLGQKVGILTDKMYRMASAGDMTSKEFRDTAKEAAAAQAQITRVDMALEAMAMTGAMRMQTALGGIQGGFDMASGAMTLFGIESEAAQKVMMKFQAVMQMTAAVTTMQQAIPAITAIKNNVIDGFNAMSKSSKAFALTGVGLVITAIAAIAVYWDDIKQAIYGVNKEQEKLYKQAQKRVDQDKKSTELLALQENSLKLQGKTEAEIRKIKMDKIKADIQGAKVSLTLLQKRAEEEQKAVERSAKNAEKIARFVLEMMTGTIKMVNVPIDAMIWAINKASELMGKGKVISKDLNTMVNEFNEMASKKIAKAFFDPVETRKKNQEAIHESKIYLGQLQSDYDALQLEIKEGQKKTASTTAKTVQETADLTREIEQERIDQMKEGREKELAQLQLNSKYELKDLEEKLKNKEVTQTQYDELVKEKTESLRLAELDINKKYDDAEAKQAQEQQDKINALKDAQWQKEQELLLGKYEYEALLRQQKFDEEIKAAGDNAELKKLLEQQYYADLKVIRDNEQAEKDAQAAADLEKRKKDFADKVAMQQQYADNVQAGLSLISNLTSMFDKDTEEGRKKAFKRNKALQIAQATVEMYKNTVAAYGSKLVVGDPSSIARAVLAAGVAASAGLVNIRNIAKQQYQSGETPPNPDNPSLGTVTTPEFNVVGNANVSALAQLTGQPIQAYVVSGDVTTAQSLDRARVNNATL